MPRTCLERTGLLVKFSDDIRPRGLVKGQWRSSRKPVAPAGWYVFAIGNRGPEAVLELRFSREVDAVRAAYALTEAGLASLERMKEAGAETVIRTAFEALQW